MGVTYQDVLGLRGCTKTANFTVDLKCGVYFVDPTGGNITVTLPNIDAIDELLWRDADGGTTSYFPGFIFVRTVAGANTITYDGDGADTVNGGATALHGLTQWSAKILMPMSTSSWAMVNLP